VRFTTPRFSGRRSQPTMLSSRPHWLPELSSASPLAPAQRVGAQRLRAVAQLTPSAEDRFLVLTVRSWGRSLRPAKGRFDPFAPPSANGRYLRNRDVESMSRIDSEAAIPIGAVDVEVVVGRGRSRGRRWTGWTRDSQPVAKTHGAFILANASCIGSAETTIIPSNGESISTMRRTAPAIESAPTSSAITTNALRGAKRPKLTNNTNSHTIMISTNGCGTCCDSSAAWIQVVFPRSAAVCDALVASARWASVWGANPVKLCCRLSSNFQAGDSRVLTWVQGRLAKSLQSWRWCICEAWP
jgi:hypothetical protein